eukprot:500584_1
MALSKQQQKVHAVFASISATLWVLAFVFFVVIFINFMLRRKQYGLKQKAPLHLATAIFILMMIGAIGFICSRFCNALENTGTTSDVISEIRELGNMVGNSVYIITYALILITFVLRLKYVFSGTRFDYPSWFYICMYSQIIFMVIASFVGQIADVSVIMGVALLLYIFNCIFLTYLFYRSLKKIMNSTGHE